MPTPDQWGQLGIQVGGQALGGIMGLALQGINDRRQIRQQEKLQQMQIRGSKELTDYNMARQLEMWKNTSYPAQMAMMKQAGLNPALLYGQGGGGGTTANIATGQVTGADAPKGGGEIMGLMGGNLALTMAQTDLAKAQAEATRAGIPKIGQEIKESGARIDSINQDIQESIAQIGKLGQEMKNLQAQEELTKTENALKQLQTNYESATLQERIELVKLSAQHAQQSLRLIRNQADVAEETKENQIKQVEADLFNTWAQTALFRAQQHLTTQQINELKAHIDKMRNDIRQGDRRLNIEKFRAETDRNRQFNEANETDDPLADALKSLGILLPIPGLKSRPNPVGFKQK